jgi:MOSC domain-containing protein YiiM
LVAPQQNHTETASIESKETTKKTSASPPQQPQTNPYGGLVEIASKKATSKQKAAVKELQATHGETMMRLQQAWRAAPPTESSTPAPEPAAAGTWSSRMTDSVVAFGKRILPAALSHELTQRPAKKTRLSFPVSGTAHFAPEDTYYYPDEEEDVATEDPVVVGKGRKTTRTRATTRTTTKGATTTITGDYNHYRLSGGAQADKQQHPTTRAVSLVTMAVYDELESVLAAHDASGDESPRVAYGDIGENFTLCGMASLSSEHSLRVGMRLCLGRSRGDCPSCGGQVQPRTEDAQEVDDEDDDEQGPPPVIEICHVNNPCYRLHNVPWSARALRAVGGSMWCHPTLKKYGWWWSPHLPLNDVLHPGGRGYLCRVVKGGMVQDGSVVTLVPSYCSAYREGGHA